MKIYFAISTLLALYELIHIVSLSKKLYDQYQYMKVTLANVKKTAYKLRSTLLITVSIVHFIFFAYTAYFIYFNIL